MEIKSYIDSMPVWHDNQIQSMVYESVTSKIYMRLHQNVSSRGTVVSWHQVVHHCVTQTFAAFQLTSFIYTCSPSKNISNCATVLILDTLWAIYGLYIVFTIQTTIMS